MKMTRRIFSLVLAMMMLVGTMFAIPAAAHEHDHLEGGHNVTIYYVLEDGTYSLIQPRSSCCSNPYIVTYQYSHERNNQTDSCVITLRNYCENCGDYETIVAESIGPCSGMCNAFPQWPF